MSFKKITFQELSEYKNPFAIFKEWGITLVKDKDNANPMTIGWGGLGILWRKPCCTVYIHKTRYSKSLFDNEKSFSVSFFDKDRYKKELEIFGSVSGKEFDKTKASGLTLNYYQDIPYYEEADVIIFCKKMGQTDFDINKVDEDSINTWYQKDGVHTIYFGEIIDIFKRKKDER